MKSCYLSLKRAQERTGANPLRFRPWIQAFRDYAFRGGDFKEERMRIQIKAVGHLRRQRLDVLEPAERLPHGEIRRLSCMAIKGARPGFPT